MSVKPKYLASLNIGTVTTTAVIAEVSDKQVLSIVGVGSAPSHGLRKGVVINIDATVESISKAISQAESMAGISINSVVASISGSHLQGFNSHGIVAIKNREVSLMDLEKVIEAAKAVAIPMDREILHVLPQEFIIDEQDGIRDPVGIAGVRLEARVHIITGAVASAQNIVKCANRCGLSVSDIVVGSVATARAVLTEEEQELGTCLIDIGGGTTDILVIRGGGVHHTAVLPVGGNHISSDISAGLRTTMQAAEELKCRYGSVALHHHSGDDTIEVASTGDREARLCSRMMLNEIIEPRVNELFTLIQRELVRTGTIDYMTSGMVITGGTARLHGICERAGRVFNIPVRVGIPRGSLQGLTDLIHSPECGAAVGLLLHSTSQGITKKLVQPQRMQIGSTFKNVGNFFKRYF